MSVEEDFRNEIYTIDASNGFLIFGGDNELLNIVYKEEWTNIPDIFSESIIYCKFFGYMKFFAVGLDGQIVTGYLLEKDKDQKIFFERMQQDHSISAEGFVDMTKDQPYSLFIREIAHMHVDITACSHKDDILVIASEDGSILIVSESTGEKFTVQGTIDRICQVEITNQYLLACTDREFMVFQGHFMIYRMELGNIVGFTVHDRNVYLILPDKVLLCWFIPNKEFNQVDISQKDYTGFLSCFRQNDFQFNENLIQTKYTYEISNVEKVLKIEETLIFAGDNLKMITKNNEFCLKIQNIIDIIHINNIIIFTTKNDDIFIGDYRSASFSQYSSSVGSIYDLVVKDDLVYVAGENGIDVMRINCDISEDGPKYVLQQ